MLKKAQCLAKLEEIDYRIKCLRSGEINDEYKSHLLRLRKNYEKEYYKSIGRTEPPVGTMEDTRIPRLKGYDGEQRRRGFFEEGFYNF